MAGIEHVPFRGSDGAGTAVIGSQVQWMLDAIPTMVENTKAASSDPIPMTPDEFAAHVRRDIETPQK
jgi:tripartite-type tricarboxylate transporter receptor subunit TctC